MFCYKLRILSLVVVAMGVISGPHRRWLLKNYHSRGSVTAVLRAFRTRFQVVPPCKTSVYKLIKRFEQTGSVNSGVVQWGHQWTSIWLIRKIIKISSDRWEERPRSWIWNESRRGKCSERTYITIRIDMFTNVSNDINLLGQVNNFYERCLKLRQVRGGHIEGLFYR